MTKFSAIVVSHANPGGCRHILGALLYQTRQPDEVHLLVSDVNHGFLVRMREEFEPRFEIFKVHAEPNENDWGHAKRDKGLGLASGDYLGFFNDDDTYETTYLEKMLAAAERSSADAVFCDWNEIHPCSFAHSSSNSGNFIVRREVALEAGWTERCYDADGLFIERVREMPTIVVHVPEILYFHNAGVRDDA